MKDIRKSLKEIYAELDAFEISEQDEKRVKQSKSSPVYGEIQPAATDYLLDYLGLKRGDVLYDLGSGGGRFILHAAMRHPLKKACGIELAQARHALSQLALKQAKKESLLRAEKVQFCCADIMEANLHDATVIYTCSTAFPPTFMDRLAHKLASLKKGLIFASLQDFNDDRYFTHLDTLRLDMTWKRKEAVYIYQLDNPRSK